MNNKVKFLRGTSDEYAVAEKDSDTIYFTTDDGKLYIGDKEISGSDITIDDTLSDTSTNPVQGNVIKQAIDNKADKTVATTTDDGLMSAADKVKLDDADNTYALKSKYGDTTIDVGRKAGSDIGERSTAEGYNTIASGSYSHAEGAGTMAYGECSHAEGSANKAIGERSHAEGLFTTAYGNYSHIEGQSISPIMSSIPNYLNDLKNMSDDEIISKWNTVEFSLAKGLYSHVEGVNSLALGNGSHAEGDGTIAKGICSHSGGADSLAEGAESFSHGQSTKSSNQGEASFGRYNKSSSDTLFSIGDGTSDSARHNAFEITTTGGKLHDKDILTSAQVIQFIPYNLKYYALNDRILLFSNDDDLTRGIYFVNNTPNDITVCALISALAEGPAVQYGYGSNTYPEIQNTGEGREWFSEESIPTSPTIFAMTVPSGKLGYYGVYHNSESTYTTIHDVRCPYFNFF